MSFAEPTDVGGRLRQLITKALGLKILNRSRFAAPSKGPGDIGKSLRKGLDCDYLLLEYRQQPRFNWEEVSQDRNCRTNRTHRLNGLKPIYEMVDLIHRMNHRFDVLPPIPPSVIRIIVSRGLDRENIMSFLGDCQQIYRFHEMYSWR